jgi:beta-glucosidase
MMLSFPKGFVWGTATASYQIEGAIHEDGRGESIWDRFSATPGRVANGDTGDPACDSYHRYGEDIAIMRALGYSAYRFSVAWPRVIPDGDGATNPAGLDYYDRLVDELLEAGVAPFLTLYHWDLPQALQDRGGWADRATLDAFEHYVDVVVSRLGNRVKYWMTHNEPKCTAMLGNETGEHAPGLKDRALALQVAHNVLVSHGRAVTAVRRGCTDARVGIVLNLAPVYPETVAEVDMVAARLEDARSNCWFLDPLAGRGYPQAAWGHFGRDIPTILPGDMELIAAPIDFLGVNYYSRAICHDSSAPAGARVLCQRVPDDVTERGWEVNAPGLYDLLVRLHREYAFPMYYVTENGAAYHDEIAEDGQVHDWKRTDYIKQHLFALRQAIEAGVSVGGYFCWSLLDNFEWAFGYTSRFGLVRVDFATQRRIIKDSGNWFGRVARANTIVD